MDRKAHNYQLGALKRKLGITDHGSIPAGTLMSGVKRVQMNKSGATQKSLKGDYNKRAAPTVKSKVTVSKKRA